MKNSGTISTRPPTADHQEHQQHQQAQILFDFLVSVRHGSSLNGRRGRDRRATGFAPAMVFHRFQAMTSMPTRNNSPPRKRTM